MMSFEAVDGAACNARSTEAPPEVPKWMVHLEKIRSMRIGRVAPILRQVRLALRSTTKDMLIIRIRLARAMCYKGKHCAEMARWESFQAAKAAIPDAKIKGPVYKWFRKSIGASLKKYREPEYDGDLPSDEVVSTALMTALSDEVRTGRGWESGASTSATHPDKESLQHVDNNAKSSTSPTSELRQQLSSNVTLCFQFSPQVSQCENPTSDGSGVSANQQTSNESNIDISDAEWVCSWCERPSTKCNGLISSTANTENPMCNLCGGKYKRGLISKPMKNETGQYICDLCSPTSNEGLPVCFEKYTELVVHRASCDPQNWRCEYCKRSVQHQAGPSLSRAEGPQGPNSLCGVCGVFFRKKWKEAPLMKPRPHGQYTRGAPADSLVFACRDCPFTFSTFRGLDAHQGVSNECKKGVWECRWCGTGNAFGKTLKGPDGPDTLCKNCGDAYKIGLTKAPTRNQKNGWYICFQCPKQYRDIKRLKTHMLTCDGGKWECVWCKCKSWQTNQKCSGPEGQPEKMCSLCSKSMLNGGKAPELDPQTGLYMCALKNLCPQLAGFKTLAEWVEHRSSCSKKKWACEWCGGKAQYVKRKPGPSGDRTLCSKCGSCFKVGYMQQPVQEEDTGLWICTKCPARIQKFAQFVSHIGVCDGLKWHCAWCNCNVHETSHKCAGPRGVKDMLCHACGKRYQDGHSGPPPMDKEGRYICTCCGVNAFISIGNLANHRRRCEMHLLITSTEDLVDEKVLIANKDRVKYDHSSRYCICVSCEEAREYFSGNKESPRSMHDVDSGQDQNDTSAALTFLKRPNTAQLLNESVQVSLVDWEERVFTFNVSFSTTLREICAMIAEMACDDPALQNDLSIHRLRHCSFSYKGQSNLNGSLTLYDIQYSPPSSSVDDTLAQTQQKGVKSNQISRTAEKAESDLNVSSGERFLFEFDKLKPGPKKGFKRKRNDEKADWLRLMRPDRSKMEESELMLGIPAAMENIYNMPLSLRQSVLPLDLQGRAIEAWELLTRMYERCIGSDTGLALPYGEFEEALILGTRMPGVQRQSGNIPAGPLESQDQKQWTSTRSDPTVAYTPNGIKILAKMHRLQVFAVRLIWLEMENLDPIFFAGKHVPFLRFEGYEVGPSLEKVAQKAVLPKKRKRINPVANINSENLIDRSSRDNTSSLSSSSLSSHSSSSSSSSLHSGDAAYSTKQPSEPPLKRKKISVRRQKLENEKKLRMEIEAQKMQERKQKAEEKKRRLMEDKKREAERLKETIRKFEEERQRLAVAEAAKRKAVKRAKALRAAIKASTDFSRPPVWFQKTGIKPLPAMKEAPHLQAQRKGLLGSHRESNVSKPMKEQVRRAHTITEWSWPAVLADILKTRVEQTFEELTSTNMAIGMRGLGLSSNPESTKELGRMSAFQDESVQRLLGLHSTLLSQEWEAWSVRERLGVLSELADLLMQTSLFARFSWERRVALRKLKREKSKEKNRMRTLRLPGNGRNRETTVRGRQKWASVMALDRATINKKFFAAQMSDALGPSVGLGCYRSKPLGVDRYGRTYWYLGGTPCSGRAGVFVRDCRNIVKYPNDVVPSRLKCNDNRLHGLIKSEKVNCLSKLKDPCEPGKKWEVSSNPKCLACQGQNRIHTCDKRHIMNTSNYWSDSDSLSPSQVNSETSLSDPKDVNQLEECWPRWSYCELLGAKSKGATPGDPLIPILSSLWVNGRKESKLHAALGEVHKLHAEFADTYPGEDSKTYSQQQIGREGPEIISEEAKGRRLKVQVTDVCRQSVISACELLLQYIEDLPLEVENMTVPYIERLRIILSALNDSFVRKPGNNVNQASVSTSSNQSYHSDSKPISHKSFMLRLRGEETNGNLVGACLLELHDIITLLRDELLESEYRNDLFVASWEPLLAVERAMERAKSRRSEIEAKKEELAAKIAARQKYITDRAELLASSPNQIKSGAGAMAAQLLPEGWKIQRRVRTHGVTAGSYDLKYISPDGLKVCRSIDQAKEYDKQMKEEQERVFNEGTINAVVNTTEVNSTSSAYDAEDIDKPRTTIGFITPSSSAAAWKIILDMKLATKVEKDRSGRIAGRDGVSKSGRKLKKSAN